MQQYWMSILKNKKIFMRNYYICKIFAMILIAVSYTHLDVYKRQDMKKMILSVAGIFVGSAVGVIAMCILQVP